MKPGTPKLPAVTPNLILGALRAVATGKASIKEVAKALTEATVNFTDFKIGSKVYIISGPGAGYRGVLKEIKKHAGMATVSGNMGNFWFVPVIFLQPDENPPSGNSPVSADFGMANV